ncbi:MAG TPA: hypothetical protein VJ673_14290 [Aromatoleum sp.]|uniref:hypothetical protein n=1 Tax=Aromatoleum sp. TaxID=2307007 RepID=UPI002B48490F|nr:hypothetical protein [Aromatoleum sp.]HJV26854.1 hypothetical protein [Aromatoleum sp.]
MRMSVFVATVTLLGALQGCGTAPVGQDGRRLTLADVGPAPQDPMQIVRESLKYRLKDPDSAKVELDRAPRPVVFAGTIGTNGGAGWELCPQVNAKNGFGAYTGYKRVFILWNSGSVVDFIDDYLGDAYCRERNDYRLEVGVGK